MAQIFITAGIFLLIIVSLFLVLIVLMQRANSDGGLGTAFGSGITESAFGTEAGNVMTKLTRITFIIFFSLTFVLYLALIAQHSTKAHKAEALFAEEAAQMEQTTAPAAADLPAAEAPESPVAAPVTAPEAPVALPPEEAPAPVQ
ncbi:MAG: preprotein translocase subunit SecG [Opitutales bacterium]|jgi:preprotein translocase subunit SecG